MENANFLDFISKNIFNTNENTIKNVNKIIDYSEKIKQKIKTGDQKDKTLYFILEIINVIDFVYNSVSVMLLIEKNDILSSCEKNIEQFINNFYKDGDIFIALKNIKNMYDGGNNDTYTYNKIIKKFENINNSKLLSISKTCEKIKSNIDEILNNDYVIDCTKIKKYKNDIPDELLLTNNTYYYLQRIVSNSALRKEIEKSYFEKSKKSLNLLAKLIVARHEYALLNNKKSYFDYITEKTNEEGENIRKLIGDLLAKINTRSRKELERIHRELKKDGYDKKVDLYDIVYYYDKLKTKILFSPNIVLDVLFKLLTHYFNLKITKKIKDIKLWDKSIDIYDVTIDNIYIGCIFIDLLKRPNKKSMSPTAIRLSKRFKKGENIITNNNIIIIANYTSINQKCMTYSDIVYLFKEFGNGLQYLIKNYDSMIINDDKFNTLFSQLMEYIAWERTTIEKICYDSNSNIIDHILFTRYIDFANSIKLRCINAIFDNVLCNSDLYYDGLIKNLKNDNNPGDLLFTIYKDIYSEIMEPQKDIVNREINGINPSIVYQQINGSECILYENILTEILSYGIFYIIKKGNGKYFIKNVLQVQPNKFMNSLYQYISEIPNSFNLYIQEVIGFDEIDTEQNTKININHNHSNDITDSTNAFNDNSDSPDVENIF